MPQWYSRPITPIIIIYIYLSFYYFSKENAINCSFNCSEMHVLKVSYINWQHPLKSWSDPTVRIITWYFYSWTWLCPSVGVLMNILYCYPPCQWVVSSVPSDPRHYVPEGECIMFSINAFLSEWHISVFSCFL